MRVCAASQTKAALTEVCKDLTPEADTDWLSGTQPCGKRRRAKKKALSHEATLAASVRMHCLCCPFFTLSAKQNRVNKPWGNSKVREQIVSFHADFNFLYIVSLIVLAVSWMCVCVCVQ